jgi:hypothetical protein
MTQTGHTPGTWSDKKDGKYLNSEYQVERERGSYTWFPIKAGRKTICLVVSNRFDDVEHKANGELIAAAPDLLSAITNLMNGIDTGLVRIETDADETLAIAFGKIRAAIAKAKGGAA